MDIEMSDTDLPKLGEVVTARQLEMEKNADQYEEFGLVWKNGVPHAVPVSQLPADHFEEATKKPAKKKAKAKAKKPAAKKKVTKPNAKKKSKKIPKFVPEWMEIREAIRAGVALKSIAEQYSVRYYDVYRVKCHGMDI